MLLYKQANEHKIAYKESIMETIFILLVIAIALDVLALKWGSDSRESMNSSEWEHRQEWETSY